MGSSLNEHAQSRRDQVRPQTPVIGERERANLVVQLARIFYIIYSAGHEDDRTFIYSLIGLYISDAASNSHK